LAEAATELNQFEAAQEYENNLQQVGFILLIFYIIVCSVFIDL